MPFLFRELCKIQRRNSAEIPHSVPKNGGQGSNSAESRVGEKEKKESRAWGWKPWNFAYASVG